MIADNRYSDGTATTIAYAGNTATTCSDYAYVVNDTGDDPIDEPQPKQERDDVERIPFDYPLNDAPFRNHRLELLQLESTYG
jgi:hypothetical protein